MNAPENPPAFPCQALGSDGLPEVSASDGMTLRDWFAGQALAGLMSNENTPFSADYAEVEPRQIAEAVYEIADAMLTARQSEQSK
jgi:hypothetical protein